MLSDARKDSLVPAASSVRVPISTSSNWSAPPANRAWPDDVAPPGTMMLDPVMASSPPSSGDCAKSTGTEATVPMARNWASSSSSPVLSMLMSGATSARLELAGTPRSMSPRGSLPTPVIAIPASPPMNPKAAGAAIDSVDPRSVRAENTSPPANLRSVAVEK